MKKRNNFTPIEDVLDVFDTNRLWYYIPGFRGYEISNDNIIRSMKHYRAYPYGILIKPVKSEPYGSSCDPLYELSDDNNKRQRIRLSQLAYLAMNNNFAVLGYPRCTIITDPCSRNKYVKNEEGVYVKVYNGNKKVMKTPPMDNKVQYAKFTIIQDGTEMPFMEYRKPDIKVPVSSIKGDEYYGRKDCRTFCNLDVYRGPGEIFRNS